MLFLEPACDGQHGYQVPSANSGFIDISIREQTLNSNQHLWAARNRYLSS
jgi:hypothetical protein